MLADSGVDAVVRQRVRCEHRWWLTVALVITLLLPLPAVPTEGKLHPLSLVRLVLQIAYYLVSSSIQVACFAIKPGPPPRNAVLRTWRSSQTWCWR